MLEPKDIQKLRGLTNLDSLVEYLRDDLDWPIEAEDTEKIAFTYTIRDLGIDQRYAVKIDEIHQIRPLAEDQPWGVFYLEFESKELPVLVLRRILRSLVPSSRNINPDKPVWKKSDLLFISSQGVSNNRSISFAHFRQDADGKDELRTFSWDVRETHLYYIKNLNLNALRWPKDDTDIQNWREEWTKAFTVRHREVPQTAEMLANEMARIGRDIREAVTEVYNLEHVGGPLHQLHLSLKMDLINDLSEVDFADMYAQTVTYGLFAARATHTGGFQQEDAPAMIAHTNPFLRELLQQMMDQHTLDLDELGVSELTQLLNKVNMDAILQSFGFQKRGEDPVIHFYETFMRAYDPVQKMKRGEFYTPDPVVSFIVRSADYLLRTEFGCQDGLATVNPDPNAFQPVVLDPATGTGTFLKYVIEVMWETFYNKHKQMSAAEREIKWNQFVRQNVLPRLYAFELKMSPYTIAHMKVGLALQQKGFKFEEGERLQIYLSNALQPAHEIVQIDTPALAHEVQMSNKVKNNVPITVIIGNPPYSVSSSNNGKWITNLVKNSYYPKDNIKEHNPKLLLDDYVKFIRFSEWILEKNKQGVFGFVTNHGFLDGPIFREMRHQLINNFSTIYILDLHGNLKTKETALDGSKDENVFDIQPGVSILLMVKKIDTQKYARVFHFDLDGKRPIKYEWLITQHRNMSSVAWKEISPSAPLYRFKPQENKYIDDYKSGWSVIDIFKLSSTGIKTHRDHFSIAFDNDTLWMRINDFRNLDIKDKDIREKYTLPDTRDWKLSKRRVKLNQSENWQEFITKCLYRPFDIRDIYYHPDIIELARPEVMEHLIKPNLCLLTMRRIRTNEYKHFFVANHIVVKDAVSIEDACYVFPLYLYPVTNKTTRQRFLLNEFINDENDRILNLSQNFIIAISAKINLQFLTNTNGDLISSFGPEDIFNYMYAIFSSSSFRQRYKEFLKIDYPRLPLTSNIKLFRNLCQLGSDLRKLHLLESLRGNENIPNYRGQGNGIITKGFPKYDNEIVRINSQQGFEGVPEEVWNFYIGGYQVCHRWLKDRRGRQLSVEDIEHYQKVVVALNETIRIMGEIDEVIEEHGGWPIV